MDIFGSSIDLTRLIFLVGAVLALVYKKKFGVTPGGIIVPGILAGILFSSFAAFLLVIASSFVCMTVYKLLFSAYALSRRWSSLTYVSISVVIGLSLMAVMQTTHLLNHELIMLSLVTPGLIAIGAHRYSVGKVMLGTFTVTALTCAAGWLLSLVLPTDMLTSLSVQLAGFTPLTLPNPYIALPLSLALSMLIYWNFGIRGGGYLIPPFIATIAVSAPLQAVLIFAAVLLSYAIVRIAQHYTLLIGLERFVLSLFCGYIMVTLMDFLAIAINFEGYQPSPLVLIIAVAVFTNDLCLQRMSTSLKRGFAPSLIGSYLARLAV